MTPEPQSVCWPRKHVGLFHGGHFDLSCREKPTETVNNGSVQFKCPSDDVCDSEPAWKNTRTLKHRKRNGIQPSSCLLFTPVNVNRCKRGRRSRALLSCCPITQHNTKMWTNQFCKKVMWQPNNITAKQSNISSRSPLLQTSCLHCCSLWWAYLQSAQISSDVVAWLICRPRCKLDYASIIMKLRIKLCLLFT